MIQQWDIFQRCNKPIDERHYQLVRPSPLPPAPASLEPNNSIVNASTPTGILPQATATISSPACARNRTLFQCIACGKDMLLHASIINSQQQTVTGPGSGKTCLAYSMLIDVDNGQHAPPPPVGAGNGPAPNNTKRLIMSSAQEVNILPFLSPSYTPVQQHQLQSWHETGRVLVCFECFKSIAAKFDAIHHAQQAQQQASSSANGGGVPLVNGLIQHQAIGQLVQTNGLGKSILSSGANGAGPMMMIKCTSAPPPVAQAVALPSNTPSAADGSLLCFACGQHKASHLVETKENAQNKPFFPFLRDQADSGRLAHLCGVCHLMLETQWDAFEAAYIGYPHRTYR